MSSSRACFEAQVVWYTHRLECDTCHAREEGCLEGEKLLSEYEEARKQYFKWLRD